jgi:hypothetical protein
MQQFDNRQAAVAASDAESGAEKRSPSLPEEPDRAMYYAMGYSPAGRAAPTQRVAVQGGGLTSNNSATKGRPAESSRGRPVPPDEARRPSKFLSRVLWYLQ